MQPALLLKNLGELGEKFWMAWFSVHSKIIPYEHGTLKIKYVKYNKTKHGEHMRPETEELQKFTGQVFTLPYHPGFRGNMSVGYDFKLPAWSDEQHCFVVSD